jgi:hypothetical protein
MVHHIVATITSRPFRRYLDAEISSKLPINPTSQDVYRAIRDVLDDNKEIIASLVWTKHLAMRYPLDQTEPDIFRRIADFVEENEPKFGKIIRG